MQLFPCFCVPRNSVQRGLVICPRSHSWQLTEPRFRLWQFGSESPVLTRQHKCFKPSEDTLFGHLESTVLVLDFHFTQVDRGSDRLIRTQSQPKRELGVRPKFHSQSPGFQQMLSTAPSLPPVFQPPVSSLRPRNPSP